MSPRGGSRRRAVVWNSPFGLHVAEESKVGKETHEEERGDAEEAWADYGYDPVHALAGCLSEPEQAYGDKQGADYGDGYAFLWLELTLIIILELLDIIQHAKNGGTTMRRRKAEEPWLFAPAVDTEKGEGEGLELEVEEGIDKAGVDVGRASAVSSWKLNAEKRTRTVDSEVARGYDHRGNLGGNRGDCLKWTVS